MAALSPHVLHNVPSGGCKRDPFNGATGYPKQQEALTPSIWIRERIDCKDTMIEEQFLAAP